MFLRKKKNLPLDFLKNLSTIIAIVLVWRGIWYALDSLDLFLFGDSHFWSAILGIILGFALIYLLDRDLEEIKKL